MVPRCSTSPPSAIAIGAPSSLDAALSRLRGKYRAQSMRALATWRARSQDRGRATLRVGSAKRSRCCLRTSSAFSVYVRGPNGARDEFILAATALRKDGKADPDAHVKADIENPQRRSAASTLAPLQLLPVFFN